MRALRVGIVCSVGGHLSELLEIEPVLAGCDQFLVLNDEAPWRRGFATARCYRMVHAERDARLLINFAEAARIFFRERPDVVISTGASPAVPWFFLARLCGVETVFIESFGAVQTPTLTGRLVYPLSRHFFVQWPELVAKFPRARYLGPVFAPRAAASLPAPELSQPHLQTLVSVGSSPRPCRRLLSWLDELAASGRLPDPLLVQSRAADYQPRNFQTVPFLPAPELLHHVRTATQVICHGGSGLLLTCLKWGRHPIVVPRRAAFGEAVNDHQLMLCQALSRRGLITVCETRDELFAALTELPSQKAPSPAAELPDGLHAALAAILRQAASARGKTV